MTLKTRFFLAVVTLLLLLTVGARAGVPLDTAIGKLPVYFEDRQAGEAKAEQLKDLARAIEAASHKHPPAVSSKDWQALLVAVAYHESTLSLRIHRGECKPHECDAGRARSSWQMHRNVFTAPVWDQLHGLEHTALQAETASAFLRRMYNQCSGSNEPWLVGTLNAYAGRRCGDRSWDGLKLRMATYDRVRRQL